MSIQLEDRSRYLRRIRRQQQVAIILHYDRRSQDLRPWFWPVNPSGARVPPSDLSRHRITNEFQAPCCLCVSGSANRNGYTECAVYLTIRGPYFGEYVAGCAFGRCGYMVCLERMYARRGLLLKKYSIRSPDTPPPPPVYYVPGSDQRAGYFSAGLSRTSNSRGPLPSLLTFEQPSRGPETTLDRLMRLDSWARPGLPEADFKRLFAKCRCGLVMTQRVFKNHICAVAAAPVVIDLTLETSDEVIDLTGDSDEE